FKQHVSLGFWGQEMTAILHDAGILQEGAMGSLGRIASPKDLPSDKQLIALFKQAAAFIDKGEYTSPMKARNSSSGNNSNAEDNEPSSPGKTSATSKPKQSMARAAKPALATPPDLAAALKTSPAAAKVFAAFSPSAKREYIDWLTEAKRPETRTKRLAQAIEQIAEGKQRNWKYQTR
ncbi:MAG TPA: YdeI/OmpD-associated family protein, partial [Acidobacteriaceae bacterium]|nr:YdeI/OmpD-associated family protein [Acidobacteriaceae bacterium]